jgi:hypothetical protein
MRPNESVVAACSSFGAYGQVVFESLLAVVHDIVCPCARPVIAHHHYQEP